MRNNAADIEYCALLSRLISAGRRVTVRGGVYKTLELLGSQTCVPMYLPVVTNPARRLGYRFMAAEAAWVLSGGCRVLDLLPYAPAMAQFADDSGFLFGAYGPKVVDQLSYVVDALFHDQSSRRAVINIWREKPPRDTRDTPCTLSAQYMVRDGTLFGFTTMRSSDAWLGTPYDWFTFSMVGAVVALELRARGVVTQLGSLTLTCASQHVYLGAYGCDEEKIRALVECDEDVALRPLDLSEFANSADLVAHLWEFARREPLRHRWLSEFAAARRGQT